MISWKQGGDGLVDCQRVIKSFPSQKNEGQRVQKSIGMVESA
jgi:hypothetical protein